MRIKIYILYSLVSLFSISLFAQSVEEKFEHLEEQVRNISMLDKQCSLNLINEMHCLAKSSPDSISLQARVLYAETGFNQRQGIVDTVLIGRIQERLLNLESEYDSLILNYALCNIFLTDQDYAEAFDLALYISEKARSMNDSLLLARVLNTLGVITNSVSLNQMSKEYYQEAFSLITPDKDEYLYYLIKINTLTLELFNSPSELSEENKDSLFSGTIDSLMKDLDGDNKGSLLLMLLLNTGNYWATVGENEKTFACLKKAQELCIDNSYIQSLLENNLAIYYLYEKHDLNQAMKLLRNSMEVMEQNNMTLFLPMVYGNVGAIYEQKNQLDSALYYNKKSQNVSMDNSQNQNISDIHRKYIAASLNISESKLALASTEIKIKNKQFVIILISSLAVLIIVLLLFIILWQKQRAMKQQVALKEIESNELSIQLEKEEALKEIRTKQIESKLREITSYSLRLSNKNQIFNQIVSIIDNSPDTDKQMKKQIRKLIKENLQMDDDWNDFMLHFNKVHPHFFEKISEIYPDVTQYESKLMAYIRLGLSIKDIAQMLNITPESVKTSRYRLRKKMNLDKDDSLDMIIQSL
ncbi:LuxR C-terminal-related transcriptional regulator [Bacteroidales bacterium OttesenSCG-928-M11]|nr:LuxR C-terminal-related transcriptional regulator [Bacteroidales bacterium OttesenSCG-928-M11]